MTTGVDWFGRLYGDGYRGLLLTAFALLEDVDEAAAVTRDALAVAYARRVRLGQEESPLEWVRAEVVRRARRRQRRRALPHRPPAIDRDAEAVRLHHLAGLPPDAIASIVDLPVDAVEAALAGAGPVSWASVRQPVVDRVRARAAQRTTRTRMLAGAAVAIVVLAVVVPMLRVEQAPAPAAAATPAAPSTSWTPSVPSDRRFVYDVKFADDYHAFALRATCESSDCDLELLASDDGRHWTSHAVRKPAQPDAMMGQLIVLGPLEVAVDWYPASPPGNDVYRVHTTDGGRTWQSVSAVPHRTLSQIPAGAALVQACFGDQYPCADIAPAVIEPGTAESARLTSIPPLRQAFPAPAPLAGDRWWIVGIKPGTLQWEVAISEDHGRTWRVSPLVRPRRNISDAWSVVGFGNHLYACAMGQVTNGDWDMVSIFHSGDGGRSWQRTSGEPGLSAASAPVAAADGTLLTTAANGVTLISRDLGRTFARTAARFTGYAFWAGAGYVTVDEPGRPIMFSRDGLSWHDLNLRS